MVLPVSASPRLAVVVSSSAEWFARGNTLTLELTAGKGRSFRVTLDHATFARLDQAPSTKWAQLLVRCAHIETDTVDERQCREVIATTPDLAKRLSTAVQTVTAEALDNSDVVVRLRSAAEEKAVDTAQPDKRIAAALGSHVDIVSSRLNLRPPALRSGSGALRGATADMTVVVQRLEASAVPAAKVLIEAYVSGSLSDRRESKLHATLDKLVAAKLPDLAFDACLEWLGRADAQLPARLAVLDTALASSRHRGALSGYVSAGGDLGQVLDALAGLEPKGRYALWNVLMNRPSTLREDVAGSTAIDRLSRLLTGEVGSLRRTHGASAAEVAELALRHVVDVKAQID